MIDGIRTWVLHLTGAALLGAAALTLAPEGKVRQIVSLACGAVMLAALLSPGIRFDFAGYAENLAAYRAAAESASTLFRAENEKISRLLIEERCAAYILDKGDTLGVEGLQIRVYAAWSEEEGVWYPYSAALAAARLDDAQKKQLTACLAGDLGIPPERQSWEP